MSGPWWEVRVRCAPADADAIAAALVAALGQAAEQPDDGTVTTAAPDEAAARHAAARVEAGFAGARAQVAELAPVDWSVRWRDGIAARRFGRLVVTPSWLPPPDDPAAAVVTLDPESAFGSGEHGSTRAALALLERHLRPDDRVLDLGSGSGILAIAAARLGAATAIGIEVDPDAAPIADGNAARNAVADRVTFLLGDAAELAVLAGPAEVVCSNILRTVNLLLLPAIARALVPGGLAIFAGMERPEEALFRPALARAGWHVVDEVEDAGWWGVAARRPT